MREGGTEAREGEREGGKEEGRERGREGGRKGRYRDGVPITPSVENMS